MALLLKRLGVGAALALLLSGCMFMRLERDLAELEVTFGIGGEIFVPDNFEHPVVAILFAETAGGIQVRDTLILQNGGTYLFLAPAGTYYVAAFEDANNNLMFDPGEAAGCYGAPDLLSIGRADMPADSPRSLAGISFALVVGAALPLEFPTDIPLSAGNGRTSAFKFEVVSGLDDERFDDANGPLGYWEPLAFLKTVGLGFYLLEPYDEDKIPVLLVHGAAGTPRIWQDLVASLDRSRFQPWIFYYPSGFPLEKIGGALNRIVKGVHQRYGFQTLFVTAHSMGGLVSRHFILQNRYQDRADYIRLFVTLSTPWGGHEAARMGVEKAPTAVPSWYDMVPRSPFLTALFERPLPDGLPYFLMFSFKGSSSLFMDNNDGAVTLASQLDYKAQAEARRLFGYNADHVGIAASPEALAQYNQLLEAAAPKSLYEKLTFGLSD